MSNTRVSRFIDAPVGNVFRTIANINDYSKAVPHIIDVELIGDKKMGLGAKFRESRMMKGREVATTLEVTEYDDNNRIRFVSDEGGTIWDTVFTFTPEGSGTRLNTVMQASARTFMAKLINPLIKGMVKKAIEADMDSVKDYCENGHLI